MRRYEKYWACGSKRETPFDRSRVKAPDKFYQGGGKWVSVEELRAAETKVSEDGLCLAFDWNSLPTGGYSWDILEDPYKRVKIQCPLCGRRLVARVVALHDGIRGFVLPRHKPKGWWKRPGATGGTTKNRHRGMRK